MTTKRISAYREFFPFYLREHSQPRTRVMHYCGTSVEIACLAALVVTRNPWWILGALLGGYGFAWAAHLFVEHNKPATFTHPIWSYIGDHHMALLALTGKLKPRLRAAGVPEEHI